MSQHTIYTWGRFVWAEYKVWPGKVTNYMWSSTGTYHRLIGKLWWFRPTSGQ